jgi:hypothetical protein
MRFFSIPDPVVKNSSGSRILVVNVKKKYIFYLVLIFVVLFLQDYHERVPPTVSIWGGAGLLTLPSVQRILVALWQGQLSYHQTLETMDFFYAATGTGAEHFGNVVNRRILKNMAAAIETVLLTVRITYRKRLRTVIHTVPYPGTAPLHEGLGGWYGRMTG